MDASSDAPAAEAPSKQVPKGTGVFFGPALASRLAGSRRSSTDSKASRTHRSLSFTNAHANAPEAHQGRGQSQACMRTSVPPKRRASMDVLQHQSNSITNLGPRNSSFTAARSCSTPGGLPQPIMNSSPGVDVSMFQLRPQQAHGPDFSANVPMAGAPKAFSVQQHPLSPQTQLQQQAHDENPLQQQLQLQEVQQLQSQLQQLLHQQQLRQQMASPQQPLASVSSTSTDGIMLVPSGPTSPDMARQLQALQQPATQQLLLSSMSSGLLDTTFAALNGSSEVQPCTHASASLSVSSLGPSPDFNTAYLPAMPSADYQAASQQQLQACATMQPVQDTSAADEAEVTVLDRLINQCMVRLLQLRNKISNKMAGCADGGASGAAAAARGPVDHTAVPSAVGFMADGMLQQTASQPLIMLQQQSSGMVAPVHLATSSITATGQMQLLQQQQQDSAAGTLALLQHGGGVAAGLPGRTATGLMVSGGNMVPLTNGQTSIACNNGAAAANFPNASTAYAHLMAHGVSGPVLVQQQPRLQPPLQLQHQPQHHHHHHQQQQQQQVLYQPAGALRLVRGSADGGDGSSYNSYINLAAGAVPQGVVLTQPAMQPAQGQGMLHAAAQQQQFAGGAVQHGDVQQLQAQLARQQLHSMLQ